MSDSERTLEDLKVDLFVELCGLGGLIHGLSGRWSC